MRPSIADKDKPLLFFLLKIGILYGIWYLLYELWIKPDGSFDHIITEYITQSMIFMLNHSGFLSHYTIAEKLGETYIFIEPFLLPVVRVGASCNGLEPLVLFAVFITAYPGKASLKLAYIPAGLLVIHGINILRNYILTIMAYYKSEYYDLFHRYVFVIFVYLIIFGFWMLWVNRLSKIRAKPNEQQQ